MDDVEENAAMINALQRHASVVVHKSHAEGFGLTVAEAMWKRRPVVTSRIGGIGGQIEDGRFEVLIPDPRDLKGVGIAVAGLLADGERARRIGTAAQLSVREYFLGPHHLGATRGDFVSHASGRVPGATPRRNKQDPCGSKPDVGSERARASPCPYARCRQDMSDRATRSRIPRRCPGREDAGLVTTGGVADDQVSDAVLGHHLCRAVHGLVR